MKILCPTDFSENSIHALNWIVELLKAFTIADIEICHCIVYSTRAGMFMKIDHLIESEARKDLKKLVDHIALVAPHINVTTNVVFQDPKSYLPGHARRHQFDFIATGVKGLSAVREMTVGSVTEWLANNSDVPILAIPEHAKIAAIKSIAFGFRENLNTTNQNLNVINGLVKITGARLELVHVLTEHLAPATRADVHGLNVDYKLTSIEKNENIANSLLAFCETNEIDVLALIHIKQNWIQRKLGSSVTKRELFSNRLPLLIFTES